MEFCIQTGKPSFTGKYNSEDKSLSDAIESSFPLQTENAILSWHHICIPLSYKYDVSYMMEDILGILEALKRESGEMVIHWLPDTFRSDWKISWKMKQIKIASYWECVVGDSEEELNANAELVLLISDFVCEWKKILYIIICGLNECGYSENNIKDIKRLKKQYLEI